MVRAEQSKPRGKTVPKKANVHRLQNSSLGAEPPSYTLTRRPIQQCLEHHCHNGSILGTSWLPSTAEVESLWERHHQQSGHTQDQSYQHHVEQKKPDEKEYLIRSQGVCWGWVLITHVFTPRSLSCNIYDHALCYMYMTLQNNLCLEKSWEREKKEEEEITCQSGQSCLVLKTLPSVL